MRIFVDICSELSGCLFDLWTYHRKAAIDFNRPSKQTDNCFVETFNESLRDECLNVQWFGAIDETRAKLEPWRAEYNESRPHEAFSDLTPAEYAGLARNVVM